MILDDAPVVGPGKLQGQDRPGPGMAGDDAVQGFAAVVTDIAQDAAAEGDILGDRASTGVLLAVVAGEVGENWRHRDSLASCGRPGSLARLGQ